MQVFDRFYSVRKQLHRVATEPPPEHKTVVALYGNAGEPTHVALRLADASEWWESKLGLSYRVVHRLRELEGSGYGSVIGFYTGGS